MNLTLPHKYKVVTAQQAIDTGFHRVGATDDPTARGEIKRDYAASGYDLVFVQEEPETGEPYWSYWSNPMVR